MYIRLSTDTLTVVQKGLTTTVAPEDRRTPRMLKEAGDTVVRLLSAVFPSSWRSGEVPHGWRKADVASTPNRANTTPASGKIVDLQTFTCLETACERKEGNWDHSTKDRLCPMPISCWDEMTGSVARYKQGMSFISITPWGKGGEGGI